MHLQINTSYIDMNNSVEYQDIYPPYNITNGLAYYDGSSDCDYNDYGGDYDYYNIIDRATQNLRKPHYIIAIVLGTLALAANMLTLIAVFKVKQVWTSHFRLLISLMISDLLIDFSVIIHVVNKISNPLLEAGLGPIGMRLKSRCGFLMVKALNTMGLNITLMNLMGMAIDHYVAILNPLHHLRLLSKGKTMTMIISFWIIAFISGFGDFLSPLFDIHNYWASQYNYCEFVWITPYQDEFTTFAIAFLCLCLMTFMYLRIYYRVQKRMQDQEMSRMNQGRKALYTTFLVLGSFMVCWLPICILQIVLLIIGKMNPSLLANVYQCLLKVDKYLYNLLILNTLIDPIIYVIRINEVQEGYRKMCGKSKLHRNSSFVTTKTECISESRDNSLVESSQYSQYKMEQMSLTKSPGSVTVPRYSISLETKFEGTFKQ